MFGIMVLVITARFGTSSEVYQPGEVSEADEFFEFQREVSSMNCLCRGLSAGRAVSGLDRAALDAELTALAGDFDRLELRALFTGDHMMGWSTTVITPPDGNMRDYLASLQRVKDLDPAVLWPTHGAPVTEGRAFVDAFVQHRLARVA